MPTRSTTSAKAPTGGNSRGAIRAAKQLRNETRDLSSEMQTLGNVIKDLEGQLNRVVSLNQALKKDLDDERQRRMAEQARVDELQQELSRSEQELVGKENLAAEVSHLQHERTQQAAEVRDLTQQLEATQQELLSREQLIERLRATRGDALEEVQSVESQFERAMQVVAQAKAQLTMVIEERDALAGRLTATDDQARQLAEERDVLVAEVDESRTLLDEIRRSLVDACVVSTTGVGDASGNGRG